MDVVFSLSNLLFEHDRVIVNGLGIFYTELEPASIHPVEHSFSPEFKKLKFQYDENVQDNLLADIISPNNGNQFIEEFVKQVKIELAEGKRVQLKNIGFLYSHHTGEVLLEQDLSFNYVKKNFGLQGFIQKPVKELIISDKSKAIVAVPDENRKRRIGLYIVLAVAILLTVLVFWKWDYIQGFSTKSPIVNNITQPPNVTEIPVVLDESVTEEDTIVSDFEEEDVLDTLTEIEDVIDEEVAVEVIEAETYEGPNFHVIAGCFKSATKADRLLNDLKGLGFNEASIEGKTPNGLIRVCYASFPERSQASDYMIKLQRQGRKGVWIQKGE